jgi:protein-tyrosine-phosphatase
MICTANICRSPVAEGLLRDRLRQRGLLDWTVSSAGTWAQVERGASENSVVVMNERGLDINSHVSRMVKREHLCQADLVLCMESGHAEALRAEFYQYAPKIHLLTEMAGRHYSISDPYGQPLTAYRLMANEVEEIIDEGIDEIIRLIETSAVE